MGVTGLISWFTNFSQFSYNDSTKENLADITNPYLEYGIYWTFKCAEISSFIGGVLVHPTYRYYLNKKLTPETTTPNSEKVIRNICRKMQGRFLISSILLAPLITIGSIYLNKYSRADVEQKCYEIRCNTNALIWDRCACVLGLVGFNWKRWQGAVDGINLALAYSIVYFLILEKYFNPMLVDRVKPEERYVDVDEAKNDSSALLRFLHKFQ